MLNMMNSSRLLAFFTVLMLLVLSTTVATAQSPDIPHGVATLDLSLPAGNGQAPTHLAIDSQNRRLYTLNNGIPAQGNSISIIDLEAQAVIAVISLDNSLPDVGYTPSLIDLSLDPYRPRLYALVGDKYDISTLHIIDTETQTVLQTWDDVDAVAPAEDRLYVVNGQQLSAVDPNSLVALATTSLDPASAYPLLHFNAEANRLYLASESPDELHVYDEALNHVNSLPDIKVRALAIAGDLMYLVEGQSQTARLQAADANDGSPITSMLPVPLSDDLSYGPVSLVMGNTVLYVVHSPVTLEAFELQSYRLDTLALNASVALANPPSDMALDAGTGLLYGAYSFPDSFVLAIDPVDGPQQRIPTARVVMDALANPDANQLYILTNDGTIQQRSLTDYADPGPISLGIDPEETFSENLSQLAYDPVHQRLYVSGEPAYIVDVGTGQVQRTALMGQVIPDPANNRLFVTPPCRCAPDAPPCNTFIHAADSLVQTGMVFDPPPSGGTFADLPVCGIEAYLDTTNQVLYTRIFNGTPGSNGGYYLKAFDVSATPYELGRSSSISYSDVAFDPPNRRAYASQFRRDSLSGIVRFEVVNDAITPTLAVIGPGGDLAYNPDTDRLYVTAFGSVAVYDGDISLLGQTRLDDHALVTYDPAHERLYLLNRRARHELRVVETSGGETSIPVDTAALAHVGDVAATEVIITADETQFRLVAGRLYRKVHGSTAWDVLGGGLPANAQIETVAVSPAYPDDSTLFVSLSLPGPLGLYRSVDGGASWDPTTQGLTGLEIHQIVFSPTYAEDQTVFTASRTQGLFRSTNGGDSWQALLSDYGAQVGRPASGIVVSPTFADDGLAFTDGVRQLLRLTNGGDSWAETRVLPGPVAFSPAFAKDRLVISQGWWRSTNAGESWQPSGTGLKPIDIVHDVLFSPNFAIDQTVYLVTQADFSAPYDIQRSQDGGLTWEAAVGGLPPDLTIETVSLLPDGNFYLTDGDTEQRTISPDAISWGLAPAEVSTLEAMAVLDNGDILVASRGAGIHRLALAEAAWQTTGYPIRAPALYQASLVRAADGTLFAGAGGAIARSTDGGINWTYLANVPPDFRMASLAVSPNFAEDGIIIAGGKIDSPQILRSVDGGDSWEVVHRPTESGSDYNLLAFSPNFALDQTVYAWREFQGLYRSTDSGLTWTHLPTSIALAPAQGMAVSADGSVHIATSDGHLYVSDNGGQSWTDLAFSMIGTGVLEFGSVLITPDGDMFVGAKAAVYRSGDNGVSWTQGQPIASGVITALAFDGTRLYAATRAGSIAMSGDLGQSWTDALALVPGALPPPPPPPPDMLACDTRPAFFVEIWEPRIIELGCPVSGQNVTLVEQTFERGRMVWREDASLVYVLPDNAPFMRYDDTWEAPQPVYSCPDIAPSETPPTPQRGFGVVWCNDPIVRQLLGNAIDSEHVFEASLQTFEAGLIFQTDTGDIYLLSDFSRTWESLP